MKGAPKIDVDDLVQQGIGDQPIGVKSLTKNDEDRIDKTQWHDTYELVDFTIPQVIQSDSFNKKFKIQVTCYDSATQRQFCKTIFFGDQNDFVFTKNKQDRIKKICSMAHKENPLHPNYWRVQLCMYSQSFRDNCVRMMDFIIDKVWQKACRRKQKGGKSRAANFGRLKQNPPP